jgi:hypothetical protein
VPHDEPVPPAPPAVYRKRRTVFLDRDGALTEPRHYPSRPDDLVLQLMRYSVHADGTPTDRHGPKTLQAVLKDGKSSAQTARDLGLNAATVRYWVQVTRRAADRHRSLQPRVRQSEQL